jgi:DNA-binding GntR family transcriptional regulator
MAGPTAASRPREVDLSQLESVERQTLADQVHAQLSEFLISGLLAPGDLLSLRRLSQTLGVSMMPVREAVTRLTADGALEVLPNRAIRVPELSADRFRDLTRVRITVEGQAAFEAARESNPADLAQIASAESAFAEEARKDDPDPVAVIRLNRDFHFAIYRAAHSPVLMEIIRGLWLKAGPIINLDFRNSRERLAGGGVLKRHGRARDAIAAGDGEAARLAIADDIQSAADFILARL